MYSSLVPRGELALLLEMSSPSQNHPLKRRRIGVSSNHEHIQFTATGISFHEGGFQHNTAEVRRTDPTIEGWEPLDSLELALDKNGQLFSSELDSEVYESDMWSKEATGSFPPLPKTRSKTSVRLLELRA